LYFADYEQWLSYMQDREKSEEPLEKTGKDSKQSLQATKKKSGRLSYIDQREYDGIEERILAAEVELAGLQQRMEYPETIADPGLLHECWQEVQQVQKTVDGLYMRWDELEKKKQQDAD
jgi:ABC transport system ATP-binding/permease protein